MQQNHGLGPDLLSDLVGRSASRSSPAFFATAQRASSRAARTIHAETDTPAVLAAVSMRALSLDVMLIDMRSRAGIVPSCIVSAAQ
jgi:hypothetical protein